MVIPTPEMDAFADWVIRLAALASMNATVLFYHSPKSNTLADCTCHTANPVVRFNTAKYDPSWFTQRRADQLAIIIHELAHAHANTPMEHGPKWGHAAAEVGALIAHGLANTLLTESSE